MMGLEQGSDQPCCGDRLNVRHPGRVQGSGTHLQKEMMVVNDKDNNMITVLVGSKYRWAVAIYTAWSKDASMRFLVNMPGMHVPV